jgi:hypothetical protein
VKTFLLAVFCLGVCRGDSAAQQAQVPPGADGAGGAETPASGAPPPEGSSTGIVPAKQSPATQTAGNSQNNGKSNNQKQTRGTSKDRLFYALPNFLTLENASNVPPLTAAQKFAVTARGSFDPVEYFWYGALAGLSQWENSESGFGQGAQGYGKRYGAYFADGTIENFWTAAILPSLLHQDPRYFQSGKGGFLKRTGYAVRRIFVSPTDSRHDQFNYSEIFGSAIASGISTFTYHPRGERNLRNAMSVWGTQVGWDTLTYEVKEFWPDIRRKLHKPTSTQAP